MLARICALAGGQATIPSTNFNGTIGAVGAPLHPLEARRITAIAARLMQATQAERDEFQRRLADAREESLSYAGERPDGPFWKPRIGRAEEKVLRAYGG